MKRMTSLKQGFKMNSDSGSTLRIDRQFSQNIFILFSILLITVLPVRASQLAQVALTDASQLEQLQRAGFDVSYYSEGGLAEVILMNDADRERLNSTGLHYFISIENIEAYSAARLARGRDDMGGYRTWTEIVAEMNRLHEDYPEVIGEPVEVGRTIEDRPIWAFKVSDNPDEEEESEPEALFTSLIHCREVITSYVLFAVAEQMAEGYGDDERMTRLVDERQTWFIPVVNPDGYAFNEENDPEGGGMWRKNRRENEDGSMGVDLNRNFGDHWGFDNVGSSPQGASEIYRGEGAFSEPETAALREFVNQHHFIVSVFFHSYSNLCLYPIGYDVLQPPDWALFAALSKRMVAENNYLPGTGWEVIYRTNGDSDDWLYGDDGHDPIYAFTIEVGNRQDYFWPPLNRVEPLVNENIEAVLTLIEYADRPHRVLEPSQPEVTSATINGDGRLSFRWSSPENEPNPATSYVIRARMPGDAVVDDAPPDQQRWENVNFNMSQNERHSGTHSYRAALQSPMSTLTLREPIIAPDTIRAWVNYNLRINRNHCLAFEASLDGWTWEALPGPLTQDFVVNNRSIGPGITGNSNGWQSTYWVAGDYAGRVIKLRYRYYSFNSLPNPASSEWCYIDDIGAFPTFEWDEEVAAGIEGSRWSGSYEDHSDNVEYIVKATDVDGQTSFPSLPAHVEFYEPQLILRNDAGWSLISAPFIPEDPTLESIFAPWIERESLILAKDGYGRFFLPSMDFNQIEQWDPLAGYWIRLAQADTLLFPGERIPWETPLPLLHGWSTISYLPEESMDAAIAFDAIVDHLIIAKNSLGQFWLVGEEFSNLDPLTPGQGFVLKMREDDTLVYPIPNGFVDGGQASPNMLAPGFLPPSPYNMSLLLSLPDEISNGWIRLYDSEGNLSGGSNVPEGSESVGIAAWSEEDQHGPGFASEETISIFWQDDSGVETRLGLTTGPMTYETDGIAIAKAALDEAPVPFELSVAAYPNPFNGRTEIEVSLAQRSEVEVEVFDHAGRSVTLLHEGPLAAGTTDIAWDAGNLPAGLYIFRTVARSGASIQRNHLKAVLIK